MRIIVRLLTVWLTIGAFLFLTPVIAYAHKSNMAVLQIEKSKSTDAPHSYHVRYSFSGLASSRLPRPILPSDCTPITTTRERKTNMTLALSWSISCQHSLTDREIEFSESDIRLEQVIYSFENRLGTVERVFNQLPQPIVIYQQEFSNNNGAYPDAGTDTGTGTNKLQPNASNIKFITMGAEHMLWGLDHVFFVILLILILRYSKNLLLAITGFTLGHSITLILAVSGTLTLPTAPVEALIALSIIFLATEGLNQHRGKATILSRYPLLITTNFGLLHGLGFAGAISDINIPESMFLPALLCFNIGIEVAQLAIVTMIYPLSYFGRQGFTKFNTIPFSLAGIISGFWFVERVVAVGLHSNATF